MFNLFSPATFHLRFGESDWWERDVMERLKGWCEPLNIFREPERKLWGVRMRVFEGVLGVRGRHIGRGWEERRAGLGWGLGAGVWERRRLIGERKKSRTQSPHLDMVLRSSTQKLLMWHEERELAFQRWEKCLLALLLREKRLEVRASHILFVWRLCSGQHFLSLPICSPFSLHFLIHSICSSPRLFPGTQLQANPGSIWSRIISNRTDLAKRQRCFLYKACFTVWKWVRWLCICSLKSPKTKTAIFKC